MAPRSQTEEGESWAVFSMARSSESSGQKNTWRTWICRQGKVVLAQHREICDTDLGGHFAVKVYESEREDLPDGTWRHRRIVLRPDTTAPGHAPMVFTAAQEGELRVIAELVGVLA